MPPLPGLEMVLGFGFYKDVASNGANCYAMMNLNGRFIRSINAN